MDFDLVPVGRITGRVSDADGRPVSGQTVTLNLTGEGGYLRQFVPAQSDQGVTNDSGEYSSVCFIRNKGVRIVDDIQDTGARWLCSWTRTLFALSFKP